MKGWKREDLSEYATAEFEIKKSGFYEFWFNRRSCYATAEVEIDGYRIKYGEKVKEGKGYGPFKHFTMYLSKGSHILRLKSGDFFDWVEIRYTEKPNIEDTLIVTTKEREMVFRKGGYIDFYIFGFGKATFEIRSSGAYSDGGLIYQLSLIHI